MHERSVASKLVKQAIEIVERSGAQRAVSVGVRLGGLSQISEPHFRAQFAAAADGTSLQDALLEVAVGEEELEPTSLDVVLTHVEVADPEAAADR
jgi:Zn finger protein HypA/HybF involved in hydrogenase expression